VPLIATVTGCPAGTSSATTSFAAARPSSSALHRVREKDPCAQLCGQARVGQHAAHCPRARLRQEPAGQDAEGTERRGGEQRPEQGQRARSETGSGSVTSGIMAGKPAHRRFPGTRVPSSRAGQAGPATPPSPSRGDPPGHSHHGQRARHTRPADPEIAWLGMAPWTLRALRCSAHCAPKGRLASAWSSHTSRRAGCSWGHGLVEESSRPATRPAVCAAQPKSVCVP
jgi:hypothetical protein